MPSSSSKLKKKKKAELVTRSSSNGSDSWKKLKIIEGEDSCGGNLIGGGAAAAARDLLLDGDGDYDVPAVSVEEQQESQFVELRLPVNRFEMNKTLWEGKKGLLAKRGLSPQLQVPIPTSTDTDLATQLEGLVKASRILHLDEKELYFVEDDDDGPFSTVNELESLYTIWSLIECLNSDAKSEGKKVLQFLQELTSDKINELCPEYPVKETFKEEAEDGKELLKWGKDNGMTADKLNITRCSETGRGVEASEDIEIGEIVLKVPGSLILDENTVENYVQVSEENYVQISEKYKILMGKDISSKEMLLLWCMMERRNPGPKFKVYFESLPPKFCTGLSFGKNAAREIQVTPLGWELQEILQHLLKQFRKLRSRRIIPSGYEFEDYMWARQLVDTNGMRIFASDGTSRLCLVPVAGFFNHSFCPHILRPEMDTTNSIIFRASRRCRKGEQCYISYGNLSGGDLVKSYGFLPLGFNLYDILTIDLETLVDDIDTVQPTAMLRTIPWSESMKLPTRLMLDLSANLAHANGDKSPDIIKSYEREALEKLLRILFNFGGAHQDVWALWGCDDDDESDRKREYDWDMKLVRGYKYLMRSLAISAIEACEHTLKKIR